MRSAGFIKFYVVFAVFILSVGIFAQSANLPQSKVTPTAEDAMPVILKHLPDSANIQSHAGYITNQAELQKSLGDRPVLKLVNFIGGTEAAMANYDAGKLLIVEYSTPQFSIDADAQISQFLTENQSNPPVYLRRVGNYEVFVFDGSNEAAANALIDQVKYEKSVQWLGQDPFIFQRAERNYIEKTGNVFVSTIKSILLGLSSATFLGIAAGLVVFYMRRRKRASMPGFSDAGGMIRLNLDELTPEMSADRLLK